MDHAPGATHEAVPLDPENDIDAKSATYWVLGGTVVLFLSLWVMVPIFVRVQEEEQRKKAAFHQELTETCVDILARLNWNILFPRPIFLTPPSS